MPRRSAKMTIYTLGQELGISPSTVSKALNHSPEISVELRTRVHNLAKATQFKPRLVSSRVPNICVLVQQLPGHSLDFSPYLARVMEGVAQYTREEGLEMSIYAADVEELNHSDVVRELRRRGVSGAVVMRASEKSGYFEQLERQQFPYISLLASDGVHTDRCLRSDDGEMVRLIMEHLAGLGHRRFAVLDHSPDSTASKLRLAAIHDFLHGRGLSDDLIVIMPEHQETGLECGRRGLMRLAREHQNVTGMLVFDYMVALGVLRGAADGGVRIPQDMSLGCFDEYPESRYLSPSLTTVGVPIEYLGYQAARDVHRQLRSLEPLDFEQDIRLRPVLNARESTRQVKQ